MKIYVAQLEVFVGALDVNLENLKKCYDHGKQEEVDLIFTPELSLCGYLPEDYLLSESFLKETMHVLHELILYTQGNVKNPILFVGCPMKSGNRLKNSYVAIHNGEILQIFEKEKLPYNGVFQEYRYFSAGNCSQIFNYHQTKMGILICEDCWDENVVDNLVCQDIDLLVSVNASPFERGKFVKRLNLFQHVPCAVLYVNYSGLYDEIVFDGASFLIECNENAEKSILQLQQWWSSYGILEFENNVFVGNRNFFPYVGYEDISQMYHAMCKSLRDYIHLNGFKGIVLGLSGGIDSAVCAVIAVDVLGFHKVRAVFLPSQYTTSESLLEVQVLAKNLKITLDIKYLDSLMEATHNFLKDVPEFSVNSIHAQTLCQEGYYPADDTAYENIQARLRTVVLMAYSNRLDYLMLGTGNKSEIAVGYTTLYGDLSGGYSILKDVYKTDVFLLAKWLNRNNEIIPQRIIDKPPSAELKHNQKDSDSLPSYEVLDDLLKKFIEEGLLPQDVFPLGYEEHLVNRVWKLLRSSEHKRKQAPLGVKLTQRAFGKDWKYPVTSVADTHLRQIKMNKLG